MDKQIVSESFDFKDPHIIAHFTGIVLTGLSSYYELNNGQKIPVLSLLIVSAVL